MHLQGALINDQNLTFMVVAVPDAVLDDRTTAEQTVQFFQNHASGLPIALVTRDKRGAPTAFYGRRDLARRLVRIPSTALPWQDLPVR
jgi:hypothetical protein